MEYGGTVTVIPYASREVGLDYKITLPLGSSRINLNMNNLYLFLNG